MPSTTSGYSGSELLALIQSYTGNTSSNFVTFLTSAIPLAELRYCKAHEWKFLKKQNLSLTVASGTDEYTLDVAGIGYYMAAEDVQNVFSTASGTYLKKTDLDTIRRMDPGRDDGSTTQYATHWAPGGGDNKIIVYPRLFQDTTLKVDGKITPTALFTLSNYPTIPLRFQDGFVEYLKALALDRENDARANGQKQFAMSLTKQDIQNDMAGTGDSDQPRIKHYNEQALDGVGASLTQLYNFWAFYGE
jgi:hypothetical protein